VTVGNKNLVSPAFVCWNARGHVPKLCVKLCAGMHMDKFRNFASSYVLECTWTSSETLHQVMC
jgi:hypothetical protein